MHGSSLSSYYVKVITRNAHTKITKTQEERVEEEQIGRSTSAVALLLR